jgi:transcriptional regulator GlxA family with amidase domain
VKLISIALPLNGALISGVVRLFKIFSKANDCELQKGKPLPFAINIVAEDGLVNLYGGHFTLRPNRLFRDDFRSSLILIPALAGNIAESVESNEGLKEWTKQQYRGGAEIAFLCTSVFLLPATGLLQNSQCKKEWFVSEEFRQQFRQVNLIVEKAVIDEELIHTNGGAYSFINEIICREADKEAATTCADLFEKQFNQECQSVAVISRMQHSRKAPSHKRYNEQPADSIGNPLAPGQFAALLNLDRKNPGDHSLYQYIVNESDQAPASEAENDHHNNNGKIFKAMLGTINNL